MQKLRSTSAIDFGVAGTVGSTMSTTGDRGYWVTAADTAADIVDAHTAAGPGNPYAGLPIVVGAMAPPGAVDHLLDVAGILTMYVGEDCPDRLRTEEGLPDVARFAGTDVDAVLDSGLALAEVADRAFTVDDLTEAQTQVAATSRAVDALDAALAAGEDRRARMLALWTMRDDTRATVAAVLLLGVMVDAMLTRPDRG